MATITTPMTRKATCSLSTDPPLTILQLGIPRFDVPKTEGTIGVRRVPE